MGEGFLFFNFGGKRAEQTNVIQIVQLNLVVGGAGESGGDTARLGSKCRHPGGRLGCY
jgi:hypothetical protein